MLQRVGLVDYDCRSQYVTAQSSAEGLARIDSGWSMFEQSQNASEKEEQADAEPVFFIFTGVKLGGAHAKAFKPLLHRVVLPLPSAMMKVRQQ